RVLHRPYARGERFGRNRFVGWRTREGVLAALQPEQDADGPWGKHGADRHSGVDGIVSIAEQLLPDARALLFVALCQREDRRSACPFDHAPQHRELRTGIGLIPIRHHLDEPGAGIVQAHADAQQLLLGSAQRRCVLTREAFVADGARRRESESAGPDRVGRDPPHGGDVGFSCGLVADRALAHHIHTHGGVRQERAKIDVALFAVERSGVLGKCLPLPMQSLVHDWAWNVLHAFHELDQLLAIRRPAGRKADAAVAHHCGGDTMPRGRRQVAVPDGLAVVVGVNIDKTGGDNAPPGFDLFQAVSLEASNSGNAPAADGNVTLPAGGPGSVNNRSMANDEIEPCAHRSSPILTTGRHLLEASKVTNRLSIGMLAWHLWGTRTSRTGQSSPVRVSERRTSLRARPGTDGGKWPGVGGSSYSAERLRLGCGSFILCGSSRMPRASSLRRPALCEGQLSAKASSLRRPALCEGQLSAKEG